MLFFPLTAGTDLTFTAGQKPARDEVLSTYEEAFRRCETATERRGSDEIAFRVSLRAPERLSLGHPDLGLVSEGVLTIVEHAHGYRVEIRARPRNWFIALSVGPWLLLLWALGLSASPWRWLLSFGAVPLFVLTWVLVWANLRAFLDHTNERFARS